MSTFIHEEKHGKKKKESWAQEGPSKRKKEEKRARHMKVQAKEKENIYIWAHEGPYKRFPCPQVRVRRRGHE
jgi:hypothetical protein